MKLSILIINIFSVAAIMLLYFFVQDDFSDQNKHYQDQLMINSVELPFSLAVAMEENIRSANSGNREIMKDDFIALIDKMQYGKNNFFFIIDGAGRMVHHPLRPDLSWWNMKFETDSDGNFLFKEIIKEAKKDGFVLKETVWKSKFKKEINEKQFIYGKYFWPWDWIVCTVLYESEIEPVKLNIKVFFTAVAAALILMNTLIAFLLRYTRKQI